MFRRRGDRRRRHSRRLRCDGLGDSPTCCQDDGGEPDIGLDLPRWLGEQGLEVHRTKPIVDVVRPGNFVWQWPATFVKVGLARLVDLGRMSSHVAEETMREFSERAQDGRTLMITPAVLEIIARLPPEY